MFSIFSDSIQMTLFLRQAKQIIFFSTKYLNLTYPSKVQVEFIPIYMFETYFFA